MYCSYHEKEYNLLCVECMINKHDCPVAMPTLGDYIKPKLDVVNRPQHYQGKVECIDAIESAIEGLDGMEAMCTGNAIKYLYRWKRKNGAEDLKKAKWYIERLLNGLDAN